MANHDSPSIHMYWWNKGNNFGDVMNPELLTRICGCSTTWTANEDEEIFVAAGSLLDTFHTKPGWLVWGAGALGDSPDIGITPDLKILAVRGPKTRDLLIRRGYSEENVPAIYGDPGLLLPIAWPQDTLFDPTLDKSPRFDIGIIPHYAFRLNPSMHSLRAKEAMLALMGRRNARVDVISPKLPVEEFLKRIANCRAIAANSLHGLICAAAYAKPYCWIHFKNDPLEGRLTSPFMGDTFKYEDFLASIGSDVEAPIIISSQQDWQLVRDQLKIRRPISFDPTPLLDAFPFKTKQWEIFKIRAQEYFADIND